MKGRHQICAPKTRAQTIGKTEQLGKFPYHQRERKSIYPITRESASVAQTIIILPYTLALKTKTSLKTLRLAPKFRRRRAKRPLRHASPTNRPSSFLNVSAREQNLGRCRSRSWRNTSKRIQTWTFERKS